LVFVSLEPEEWTVFLNFRMRSFRFPVIIHGDKHMGLSGLGIQCFDIKGCALKFLQTARPSGLMRSVDFLTASEGLRWDIIFLLFLSFFLV